MKRILFVDDEPNILQGLKRMLRSLRHEWTMHFALGAEEALDIAEAHGVDVIVSDMRMPKYDGAWLLGEAQKRFPDAARIILSGHSEQEMTIRSVAATHQFLAKPCDAELLRETILRTLKLRDMMRSSRLQKLATEIGRLPSVPETYRQLNAEMGKEDMSMQTVAEIVEQDLAMSAKILQLVNSAFFGLRKEVGSVSQAVAYLGTEVIRALVLSEAAFKSFDGKATGVDAGALMRKGQAVASVARAIAKQETKNKSIIDEVFQASMMHELGRLILAAELPDDFVKVSGMRREGVQDIDAEREVFEVTHSEVGAYLLGLWGMSDGIVEAIAYCREPDRSEAKQFAPLAAVHAAVAFEAETSGQGDAVLNEAWLEDIGLADRIDEWRALADANGVREDAA
ncbi:MAG: response regulator [Pseudomonadota bacterium]